MKIFISGGAGYIGSAMAEILLNNGYEVTIYDSLVSGHKKAIPTGAEFVQADLADVENLRRALNSKPFDAIMHFAAFIEAGESMKNPYKFYMNNLVNSLHLIEESVQAGIHKFVLSSTAAVYATSDELLTEESNINPANVYGHSKLVIEQTLEWYRTIYNMHYAVLRYFNAAGAYPHRGEAHQPESHLIPLVLKVALGQREYISIFGNDYPTPDGTNIRDYIHIADLVSAHLLALEHLEKHDKLIYNLGNGKGYSVLQVIETARKITGHPIPAVVAPRRAGDSPRLVASSEKIHKELGWQPQFPHLEQIIASAWQWHSSHPHGYDNA